jgi:hypothetical protein
MGLVALYYRTLSNRLTMLDDRAELSISTWRC